MEEWEVEREELHKIQAAWGKERSELKEALRKLQTDAGTSMPSDELNAKIKQLQDNNGELVQEIEDKEKALEAAAVAATKAQQATKEAEQRCQALEQEMFLLKEERDERLLELDAQIQDLKEDRSRLSEERVELQDKRAAGESACADLEQRLAEANLVSERLARQLAEHESAALPERLAEAEAVKDRLAAQIGGLEGTKADLEAQLAAVLASGLSSEELTGIIEGLTWERDSAVDRLKETEQEALFLMRAMAERDQAPSYPDPATPIPNSLVLKKAEADADDDATAAQASLAEQVARLTGLLGSEKEERERMENKYLEEKAAPALTHATRDTCNPWVPPPATTGLLTPSVGGWEVIDKLITAQQQRLTAPPPPAPPSTHDQERMKHDYAFRTGNSTPRDLYPPRSARGRSTSPPLRHRVTDATIAHLRDRVQALGVEASHARKLHHEPQPERLGVKPLNHKSLSRSPPPPTTPMVAEKDNAPDRYTAAALRQTQATRQQAQPRDRSVLRNERPRSTPRPTRGDTTPSTQGGGSCASTPRSQGSRAGSAGSKAP